jgi:hypothetical protein
MNRRWSDQQNRSTKARDAQGAGSAVHAQSRSLHWVGALADERVSTSLELHGRDGGCPKLSPSGMSPHPCRTTTERGLITMTRETASSGSPAGGPGARRSIAGSNESQIVMRNDAATSGSPPYGGPDARRRLVRPDESRIVMRNHAATSGSPLGGPDACRRLARPNESRREMEKKTATSGSPAGGPGARRTRRPTKGQVAMGEQTPSSGLPSA